MGKVFVIGLAGGIGCGKSTVAAEFAKLGAEVLDADTIVHELHGEPEIIRRIAARFGDVLDADGKIDRKKLAAAAFVTEEDIKDLEAVLHPAVIKRTEDRISRLRRTQGQHVVVIDAPLLFEARLDRLCDEIIYVDVPQDERIKRVKESRGWTCQELKRREKRQKTLDYKQENADITFRNSAGVDQVAEQVRSYWQHVQTLLGD